MGLREHGKRSGVPQGLKPAQDFAALRATSFSAVCEAAAFLTPGFGVHGSLRPYGALDFLLAPRRPALRLAWAILAAFIVAARC
jgi:hypothetical protein